jgi:hypothetical protein
MISASPNGENQVKMRSKTQHGREDSIVSLLDEIRGRLELLESNLPKRVDGWALSQLSKLPFKVLVYREALSWRMAELGRAAFDEFEKDRLASAIVLTRAAVETNAALWYLCAKVDASVESAEVGDIDDYVMKMSMGIATDPPTDAKTGEPITPRPVKIGKFLDCVEKDIAGFNEQYGYLSEYVHPTSRCPFGQLRYTASLTAAHASPRGKSKMRLNITLCTA